MVFSDDENEACIDSNTPEIHGEVFRKPTYDEDYVPSEYDRRQLLKDLAIDCAFDRSSKIKANKVKSAGHLINLSRTEADLDAAQDYVDISPCTENISSDEEFLFCDGRNSNTSTSPSSYYTRSKAFHKSNGNDDAVFIEQIPPKSSCSTPPYLSLSEFFDDDPREDLSILSPSEVKFSRSVEIAHIGLNGTSECSPNHETPWPSESTNINEAPNNQTIINEADGQLGVSFAFDDSSVRSLNDDFIDDPEDTVYAEFLRSLFGPSVEVSLVS
ncbi:unnamed protein product [Protopolystoma xenopodis]|uniref:Uncharacterized protein n=1 Tax=Protopolystoma xenopodis TaxID=117903 RepID=A0A448X306_9PLAT|nr:unnamed protein product [Protopolystoma xenopodis]